jgi:anti-sigma B factor antagonist
VELSIADRTDSRQRHVLALTGSLDLASRDVLYQAGVAALSTPDVPGLVVDLAGVTFLDSSGIGALVELAGDAQDAGVGFALHNPSERVRRVLTISGLLDAWPIEKATERGPAED